MSQAQDESVVDSGGDRRGSFWMMTHLSPPNQRFGQVVHLARIIRGPDTSDPTVYCGQDPHKVNIFNLQYESSPFSNVSIPL